MPISLHFYLKNHNIYFYNPSLSKNVQMNCPDISESKSGFPDKNNLFASLSWSNLQDFKISSRAEISQVGPSVAIVPIPSGLLIPGLVLEALGQQAEDNLRTHRGQLCSVGFMVIRGFILCHIFYQRFTDMMIKLIHLK